MAASWSRCAIVLGIDPEGGRRVLDVPGWKDELEGNSNFQLHLGRSFVLSSLEGGGVLAKHRHSNTLHKYTRVHTHIYIRM